MVAGRARTAYYGGPSTGPRPVPAPQRATLRHALNLLADAAIVELVRRAVTVSALIGSFAHGPGSWHPRTRGS